LNRAHHLYTPSSAVSNNHERAIWWVVLLALIAGCGGSGPALRGRPLAFSHFDQNIRFGSVAAPSIGEVFTTTDGRWTGNPTFTYQWKRCNTAGEACVNIGEATMKKYMVVIADEGHRLRSAVTATNGFGVLTATSAATGIVEGGGGFTPTFEVEPATPAATIEADAKALKNGQTLCFKEGEYPFLTWSGGEGESNRTEYVSFRPCAGAEGKVTLTRVEPRKSSFERWEHLKFKGEGLEFIDAIPYKGSHDYEVYYDEFEGTNGVVAKGPTKEGMMRRVTIEHNYFHNIDLPESGIEAEGTKCKAGASGQAFTAGELVTGTTFSHNTVNEVEWHYLQYGGGEEGAYVEHNLFMGIGALPCAHLNVWQETGGENIYFKHNVVIGKGEGTGVGPYKNGSEYASDDALEFENGGGSISCTATLKNIHVEDNLFGPYAGGGSHIWKVEGLTVARNTMPLMGSAGFGIGLGLKSENACRGAGTEMTTEHNLIASSPFGTGEKPTVFVHWNHNVATDKSSQQWEGVDNQVEWAPKWKNTTWNVFKEVNEEGKHFPDPPAGYYIPEGVTVEGGAGYEEGTVGP